MPPPAELRNRPQDGISWVQKVAAVEIGFGSCSDRLGVRREGENFVLRSKEREEAI